MRTKKRILSTLLTVCLIVGMLPQTAFATEGATIGTSGLCEHHAAHDETCGYVEGIAETPCTHEHTEDCSEKTTSCTHTHTEDCYPVSDSGVSGNEASPSNAAEPTACVHECSEESGCITEGLNCTHTAHDDTCGYIAAVEGHDCHYECAECAEQEQAATPADATEAVCTCEAAEGKPHTEDCALYEAPADPTCTCETKCAEDAINAECTVCGVTGAASCIAEGETATYEETSVMVDAASLTSGTSTSGTGWSFDGIYLTLESGYEFTINGDCYFIVENCGTILDGTFNKLVRNYASGTISGGTFVAKVNNQGLICDGTFNDIDGMGSGKINGGTFGGTVTLMGSSTIGDGTFDGTVTLMGSSTISDGIFNGKVENFATVSGGAFNGDVVNWSSGTISKGEFNGTVKNTGMITGGTFTSITDDGEISLSDGGSFSVEDTSGFSGKVSVNGAEHTHSYSYEYEPSQTAGKHDLLSICKGCPINKVSRTEEDCTPGDAATCTTPQTCTDCGHEIVSVTAHSYGTEWSKDSSNHWHECTVCGDKKDSAAHTPGAAATETTAQTCTVCGYEIAPALGHTHSYGAWQSNGNGMHTRTCSGNSDHKETVSCSGGTATCKDKAICSVCNTAYGSTNSSNHTGGTEVRGKLEATATTAGYTGDTYCLGCKTKIKTGTTIPATGSGGGGTGGNTGGGDSGNDDSGDDTPPADDDKDDTPSDTPADTPATPVTVPVSGEDNSIQVDAAVSGTTATIDHVDLSALNTVIGDHVENVGVVTIDFSVLNVEVDTVEIPADVVKQIAEAVNDPNNDAQSLEIVLTDGTSIEFDAKALGEKSTQAGGLDITISIKHTTDSTLNNRQQQTIGNRPAYDINVTSGGKHISDMGGKVTVHAPYELRPGEKADGIVVFYVDAGGNREHCETSYDPVKKRVNWKTDHLSVYMISYEEPQENPDTGDDTPAEEIPTSPDTGDDTPAYVTYTVQRGDTLWAIAKKYGCTVSDIVAANSGLIKDPDLIYAGWQLTIPQAGATGTDTTPDAILPDDKKTGVYIVKRGDTLWAISKKYGCTVAEIVALNGELIADPDLIFAGWEIKIPQD